MVLTRKPGANEVNGAARRVGCRAPHPQEAHAWASVLKGPDVTLRPAGNK